MKVPKKAFIIVGLITVMMITFGVGFTTGERNAPDGSSDHLGAARGGGDHTPFITPGEEQVTPQKGTDDLLTIAEGSVIYGDPDADVRVETYDDFLCPFCKDLMLDSADWMTEMAESGEVAFEFIAIDYLGLRSTNHYSARAANASTLVADRYPDKWLDVKASLMNNQPTPYDKVTDEDLVKYVEDAGVSLTGEDKDALIDLSYLDWVNTATANAAQREVSGIPTVFINGDRTDIYIAEDLVAEIEGIMR